MDGNETNGEESISASKSLENITADGFDKDKAREAMDSMSERYGIQNGGGYSSGKIRNAKKTLDDATRMTIARQTFQNETLQIVYFNWMRLSGKDSSKIYNDATKKLEQDINNDFSLLSVIDQQYNQELATYDLNRRKMDGLFRQQDSLELAKNGYESEVKDTRYLLTCKGNKAEPEADKLKMASIELYSKKETQLNDLLRNDAKYMQRCEVDLARNFMEQNLLDAKLNVSKQLQQSYKDDMNFVMKSIVSTIDQMSRTYPVDLGNILGVKMQIATRMEEKEKMINGFTELTDTITGETNKQLEVFLNPYTPRFMGHNDDAAMTNISEALEQRSSDNELSMDKLKVRSQQFRNKYQNNNNLN